jgi:predicted Zn finger-like uncharacterized protein
MNYITACPNCGTQFMLNDEHIKAYDGDVQCGNCEHIFNTKDRLTELPADVHSTSEYHDRLEAAKSNSTPEPPVKEVLNVVLDAVPSLSDLDSNPMSLDDAGHVFANHDGAPFIGDVRNTTIGDKINAPIVIEDLTVHSPTLPNKTKSSIVWPLLAFLLLITAGLQSVYYLRDKIASEYPQMKPLLVKTCAALKCEIRLPKNLALLTIDGSDMQENEHYQDVINFSSVIINSAHYAQALPNIELTITDLDDKPLVKRLVLPKEYLEANADLAAGIAAHQELPIKLKINVNKLPAAGYRVLLAY